MIFMVVIWVASAFLCAYVGGQKNRDNASWFLAGLFFGVFAVIAVVAVPTLTDEEQRKRRRGASLKKDLEMGEWEILVKYDPSTRAAVQKLDQYGPEALNKLKRAYAVVKNKDQLLAIADEIGAGGSVRQLTPRLSRAGSGHSSFSVHRDEGRELPSTSEKARQWRVNHWRKGGALTHHVGQKGRGHVANHQPGKPTRPLTA